MTMVEWNRLPTTMKEAPSVDTINTRLYCIRLSTYFIRNSYFVTTVGCYAHNPTTGYPVHGDLLVVLNRNKLFVKVCINFLKIC